MIYVLNKENFKFIGRFDNMKFAKEMLNKEGITEDACIFTEDIGMKYVSRIVEVDGKVIYMNKDWPEVGKNRKSEIYYYVVKTNKKPDINKASYTESEKKYDFKIETIPLDKAIATIEENISKNEKNIVIARDTIIALRMCLKKYN